jgi:phage shock protein PspC (stress-responsive transcriptional regulator)
MTTPPPSGGPGTGYREDPPTGEPSGLDRFFDGLRNIGLRRRRTDKWLGGVSSGLADRLGVDPLVTRAGFILLGLLFGIGVSLYLLAWVLLADTDGEIPAERALRDGDAGSVVLLVITGLVLFSGFPWWWDGSWGPGIPWALIVVGLIIWWVWAWSRGRAPGQRRGESAEEWGRRVNQQATQWGQNVGTQAAQWGQQTGERVSTAAQQWGRRTPTASQTGPGQAGPGPVGSVQGPGTPPPPGQQGARGWQPAAPPPPPYRGRPRRRSTGFLGVVVAVGLGLVAYGVVQWADGYYGIPGNGWAVGIAAALAAVGLFLLAVGLAGRRGGFVSFLGVVGIVVAVVASVVPQNLAWNTDVHDQRWAPTRLSSDTGYSLDAGTGVLDLSRLSAGEVQGREVEASVSFGVLRVIVPEDVTTRVVSHVGIGQVDVDRPATSTGDGHSGSGGLNVSKDVTLGDGPTDLVVRADMGIGQIDIQQEAR